MTQRADARRNREQLVTAAAAAFAEQGPGASLDAIARAAGLGSGTLYRHFPTREDLVRAVYRARVDEACARGAQLRAADDALDALWEWLGLLVGLSARNGPAGALIADAPRWPRAFAAECHADLTDAGTALVERARPRLRDGVTLADLHALAFGIGTAAADAAGADRLLDLARVGAARP